MTSFTDPMQELNQKVLEKQAHGLLAEIETNLVAGNLPAAFERLYFYISQNHSQEAARSITEKFPEIAAIFSARDALLAFANRDKALACWQAFVEAEKLVAASSLDEATSLLRRARAGFAGTPEFAKVSDAWTSAKAEQLRLALMRGDEQTAKKLEKEIDCKEVAAPLIESVKNQFTITCNPIEMTKVENGMKLLFDSDESIGVKCYLNNYGSKLLFARIYDENKHSIIVADLHEMTASEYHFAFKFTYTSCNFFEIDEANNIFGLITEDFVYIRIKLERNNSSIKAVIDISAVLDTTSAYCPWINSPAQHKSNFEQLYFTYDATAGDKEDTEKYVCLDLHKNKIIHQLNCDEYLKKLESSILVPGITPTFFAGSGYDYAGLYNNKLECSKRIYDEIDFYVLIKCKSIDYVSKTLCFIAEGYDEIYDLYVTDFSLNIKETHKDIFSSSGWWHEDNAHYDTANGFVYFEGINLQVYDYKNKRYILTFKEEYRSRLIYFKQNNKPLIWEVKDNTINIIDFSEYILGLHRENDANSELALSRHLSVQNTVVQSNNEVLERLLGSLENKQTKKDAESRLKQTLKSVGRKFYMSYIPRVRQALQDEELPSLIEQVTKERPDISTVKFRVNAIANAVRQGYDRDL